MTNAHVINNDLIDREEGTITIKYDNETKELNIKLDRKERIIECFNCFQIDITIVEIIPTDGIEDKTYFLYPNINTNFKSFIGKDIYVIQFPEGEKITKSEQKITEGFKNIDYMFYHNASTIEGSSGSPIILKDDDKVLGIHKGAKIIGKKMNMGIFISIITEAIKDYKRNGEGKDFYENGKIKYEGNFKEDEYDDVKGKFYDEDGNKYEGQFNKGKKNGEFSKYNKDGELIKKIKYKDDVSIEETEVKNTNNEINNGDSLNNLVGSFYEITKSVADKLELVLCQCGHESKYHNQVKGGKEGDFEYKCSKCDSFCYLDANGCLKSLFN